MHRQRCDLRAHDTETRGVDQGIGGLSMGAVLHEVCLISRMQLDDVHSQPVVAPITDFIKSRLANQFRRVEPAEQIRLYKYFAKVPDSKHFLRGSSSRILYG